MKGIYYLANIPSRRNAPNKIFLKLHGNVLFFTIIHSSYKCTIFASPAYSTQIKWPFDTHFDISLFANRVAKKKTPKLHESLLTRLQFTSAAAIHLHLLKRNAISNIHIQPYVNGTAKKLCDCGTEMARD